MNRRGFLSILGISGVGLAVPKWMVYEPEKLKAVEMGSVNLRAITLATATELERALKGYKYAVASDWTDGHGITRPPTAGNRQVFDLIPAEMRPRIMGARPIADFDVPMGREIRWVRTYAKPGAERLSEQIKASGLDYFAAPRGTGFANQSVVVKAPGGLYVRGYVLDKLGSTGQAVMSFDLIGAA